MQCEVTQSWRTINGVICPIISDRNRPNPFGLTYQFGKKKGQLRKLKTIKVKDLEKEVAENSV